MAGKRLGTVFVELGLDSKEFTKGEAKILQQAQTTSLRMEEDWRRLGSHSDRIFNAMRDNVINAQNAILNNAKSSAAERMRAEEAAAAKITQINEQQFGRQTSMIDGLKKNWLAATAIVYAAMRTLDYVSTPFKKGFDAVEDYGKAVASLGAMVVTFSERQKGVSLEEQWRGALQYSTAMVPILENIAARTLLSGQETTALANAFARSGVFLDANNSKQVESFTRISNALPLMTQGQEIMRQINTEIRSVMTGNNEQSSMMLQTLKAIDPEIEKHLKAWRAEGTVLENIGGMLAGFGPATKMLENEWQAVKSTIDTTATQILRGLMKPAYEEIIEKTKELNSFLIQNKDNIAEWGKGVQERMRMVKEYYDTIAPFLKLFMGTPYKPPEPPKWVDPHSVRDQIVSPPKGAPPGPTKEQIDAAKKAATELKRLEEEAKKYTLAGIDAEKAEYEDMLRANAAALDKSLAERKKLYDEDWKGRMAGIDVEKAEYEKGLIVAAEAMDAKNKLLLEKPEKDAREARDLVTFYSQIGGMEAEYRNAKLDWIEKEAAAEIQAGRDKVAIAKWVANQKMTLSSEAFMTENADRQAAFSSMAQSFSSMAQLYAEDSKQRQVLSAASKVATMSEIGLQVQKNLMIAVGAVVNQGTGDPYSAFARIAAMIAVVSGVLSIAGIAFGGGVSGGGGASKGPQAYAFSDTVLGAAAGTGSESIQKSFELLKDTYSMEYRELSGIYSEMKELNDNITGLVTSIVRTGSMNAPNISTGVQIGSMEQIWRDFDKSMQSGFLGTDNFVGRIISKISNLDVVGSAINGWIGDAVASVFGGASESFISSTGIYGYGKSIRDLQAGQQLQTGAFTSVTTNTDGGWFGSDSTETQLYYSALNQDVTDLLTKVFKGMGGSIVALAEGLGQDVEKAKDYLFPYFAFNFLGMSTEQIESTITTYFSTAADTAVKVLFGDLLQGYQEINESLMQTATRILIDKTVILDTLEMTGQAFTGTVPEIIAFSETIIDMAGGLDTLRDAAEKYYDAFFSDEEKLERTRGQMLGAFEDLGYAMPQTREAYRAIVEGLDLTQEAGQKAYVTLMNMAEASDKYYDALDEIVGKLRDARESMKMEGMEYAQSTATSAQLSMQTILDQARQGNFANVGMLDKSLSTLTSSASSTDLFATREDYQANYWKTYNSLAELEALIGGTIPIDEQALNVAQDQLSVLQNIDSNMAGLSGGSTAIVASSTYTPTKSSGTVGGADSAEIVAAINALREELRTIGYPIAKATESTANTLRKFDEDGVPAERVIT